MALVNITPDTGRLKDYWGTIHKTRCLEPILNRAVQILGAIPADIERTLCSAPCVEFTFVEGDFTSFLFRFPTTTGDDYKLQQYDENGWTEVVTGNPDNVLGSESGTKFDIGFDSEYPDYGGFRLDFTSIFANFGAGKYRLFLPDNNNVDDDVFSLAFNVKENTCENTDGTFFLRFESKGRFENFDYTKTNGFTQTYDLIGLTDFWLDGCRYDGRIRDLPIETDQTNIKFGDFSNEIHVTEDRRKLELTMFKTSYPLYARLYLYGLRSKDIRVTDGNSDATYNLDQYNVVADGDSDFEDYVNVSEIFNVTIQLSSEFDLGYRPC